MVIAICEDKESEAQSLGSQIRNHYTHDINVIIHFFRNGDELLSAIIEGHFFDAIFLDIYMPIMTGMEAAQKIREIDSSVLIIFVSYAQDFAVQGYDVDAVSFLVKPYTLEKLNAVLNKLTCRIMRKQETIEVRSGQTFKKIYLSNLSYVEKVKKKTLIHEINGCLCATNHTIGELAERLLELESFTMPNQGYIVNLEHVDIIKKNERLIIMNNGDIIPVSRDRIKNIMDSYVLFGASI